MSPENREFAFTRRQLIKAGVLTTGGALLGDLGLQLMHWSGEDASASAEWAYPLAQPENIIYTTCLQCNTQCTLKTKALDGVLVKIDGNPYSPINLAPHLSYDQSPTDVARVDGSVCPKGQAGVQTLYDPYRLRKVLKRVGARGANQWQTVPFDQAITEIVQGGKLFANSGEDRQVSGFKDVFVLRDAKLSQQMAADVATLRSGKMTVDDFKARYQDHLDVLIDPDHPDLGPKNNQFVLLGGRISPDRETFAKRFTFGGLGSVNWYGHTTICEQAHHVAYLYATAQWTGDTGWQKGTNHMKPDYTKSEFVIFWGTGFNEANFGPTPMSPRLSQSIVDGNLKIAVVDPRLSKSAAKGWWIPVKPGGDLALALGMIRWVIDNKRYDEAFLRNANIGAAAADHESSYTNSSWLVNTKTGKFIRAADAGVGTATQFVVLVDGTPTAVDPNDKDHPVVGDLDVSTTLGSVAAKSGFRMLKDQVSAQPLDFYVQESGLDQQTIINLATEFTAHGKKAAIDFYRGPIKLTYGYYAAQAIIGLNYLIGNVDHVGGLVPGGGAWDSMGTKAGKPFNLSKLHTGVLTQFGIKTTRESSGTYESSTLFKRDNYPAKRPWFPFTGDVYQEVIPAAYAGYPYPIKILWLHYGTPALATPAGHLQIKMLQDTEKFPLLIATDVVIGETSMYADYIFPDLTYLERWSNPIGTSPVILTKISKFRQPVVAPIPEIVTVDGEQMPISMDAVMIAIAKQVGAPGYGKDGFAAGVPFNRPEDYYLKMIANVAWGDADGEAVPEASDAELQLLQTARQHLPTGVFDLAKWQAAVGPHWNRVAYLLNRGGRFEAADKAYKGDFVAHAWGKLLDLYVEPVGAGIHSVTAKQLSGVPVFQRLQSFNGDEVNVPAEFDLSLFTYKEITGGQSRTVGNYVGQMAILPENFIYLSAYDADRLSLKEGNIARLESPDSNGEFVVGPGQTSRVEGRVKVIQGIRPGSVAVSWSYGHWAYGARDVTIDNQVIKGEIARGKGLVPNPTMAVDGYLKDISLTDPIAGDAAYSASKVKLVKVSEGNKQDMPQTGYMSEGPALALAGAQNLAGADEILAEALRVARGEVSADALRAEISRRTGVAAAPKVRDRPA